MPYSYLVKELAETFEILSLETLSTAPHFGGQEPEVVKKKERFRLDLVKLKA